MKDLLCVVVADDGDVLVSTEYFSPMAKGNQMQFNREDPLYGQIVDALKQCGPDCLYAIRLLESARKDARYNYLGLHPGLEEALADWRRKKAAERNLPAYYILHQSVLLGIADAAPKIPEELLAVPGFGPGLFDRYGEEILRLTKNY